MPKRRYKTSSWQRRQALAYYYANKAAVRRYQRRYRRARGIRPRKPAMTDARKLTRVLRCKVCKRRITTPAFLRAGRRLCRRCRRRQDPAYLVQERERAKLCRQRNVTKVRKEKLRRGCERCGYRTRDPKRLDFHHRDQVTKLFRLSGANRYGWVKIAAEMAKCDVLCKTCHREVHPLH